MFKLFASQNDRKSLYGLDSGILPLQSTIKSLPTKGRQRLLYDNPFRIFTVLFFCLLLHFTDVFFSHQSGLISCHPRPHMLFELQAL